MRVHAGTSGYSYPAWKGRFYPADIASSHMLDYYASRFDVVEINSSFYRLPAPATIAAWAAQVPLGFRFAMKAPRTLTQARDFPNPAAVDRFLACARGLGDRLGPLLLQLPRDLVRDVARLKAMAALIPADVRAAFEFRDPSWFEDGVFAVLRDAGFALCITDTDSALTPALATADWLYLRLRRTHYSEDDLRAWMGRLEAMQAGEVYVFFRHEDEARGIRYAARMRAFAME